MTKENFLTKLNSINTDLKVVKELVYDKCGFDLTNLKQNIESKEYGACSFKLNNKTIQYRASKITPTKSGQFVTIWKRNKEGLTVPFDIFDDLDYIFITSKSGDNFGQFIFSKLILAERGIITYKGKIGKRGIRVYPPWDLTISGQAKKTQSWQSKYFITIKNGNSTDLDLIMRLFIGTNFD